MKGFGVSKRCVSEDIMRLDISAIDRFVLAIVVELLKNGGCLASNEYISDKLNFSIDQVRRSIERLTSKKYLKRSVKNIHEGRGTERILSLGKKLLKDQVAELPCGIADQVAELHRGGWQNCHVVVGHFRGILMSCVAGWDLYTTEYTTDNNNIKGTVFKKTTVNASTLMEENKPPFQTFRPKVSPTTRSNLETELRRRVTKHNKSFYQFSREEIVELEQYTLDSLLVAVDNCAGFVGINIRFSYFRKVLETHGVLKTAYPKSNLPVFTPKLMTL